MFKGPDFTFLFIILIVTFVASLLAINEFTKVGKAKGYAMDNAGLLWFIGICMPLGPLAVGLYVTALPDRSQSAAAPAGPVGLPSIDGPASGAQTVAPSSATPAPAGTAPAAATAPKPPVHFAATPAAPAPQQSTAPESAATSPATPAPQQPSTQGSPQAPDDLPSL